MKARSPAMLAMFAACVAVSLVALKTASSQDGGPPQGPPGARKGQPGPPGFGPGTFLGPQMMEVADSDGDGKLTPAEAARAAGEFVRSADADKKGSVDAAALGRAINRKLRPPGVGPGDGPPGDDFGPGTMMAGPALAAADSDKDGRLSPEEASRAAENFIREATGKDGVGLDGDALADAMNRRMGPPPGFGPGGPMGQERAIVKEHDKDKDGRLNAAERLAAREALKKAPAGGPRFGPPGGPGGPGRGPGGPGGPRFGPGGDSPDPSPGAKVSPADVASFPGKPFYDPAVVRTLFLDFEGKEWETEMAEFYRTDVEVPAKLTVDGKVYPDVGVHFRGLSSFMMVRAGQKRSLNVSIDFAHPKQRLMGYKTLNLLNAHEDSTFLHTVLYLDIARRYTPAPRANFVRVVLNGEDWGIYSNAQQFDKTFLEENYKSPKGSRWKVPGNPGGDGGLAYVGDDVEEYKKRYQLKSDDGDAAWKALIDLCLTLNVTPAEELEQALKGKFDIDGALWFLAMENVFINSDGYWIRASDYSIFRDGAGIFHILTHDANETFGPAMMMGPPGGMRRGPGAPGKGAATKKAGRPGGGPPGFGPGGGGGGPGVELDPLYGLDDPRKPLRSKLLAVPALRDRYLKNVRTLAETWLDWSKLGPLVADYRRLIDPIIEADTKKLATTEAYQKAVSDEVSPDRPKAVEPPRFGPGGGPTMNLRTFAERRRAYLLNHPEIKKAGP
jgi:hypothetical protein